MIHVTIQELAHRAQSVCAGLFSAHLPWLKNRALHHRSSYKMLSQSDSLFEMPPTDGTWMEKDGTWMDVRGRYLKD